MPGDQAPRGGAGPQGRRRALAVIALVMSTLMVSCTQAMEGCTAIGGSSGVNLVVEGPLAEETWQAQVCIGGDCRSSLQLTAERRGDAGRSEVLFVEHDGLASTDPTEISVELLRDGDTVRPRERFRVSPRVEHPNGERCEPELFIADVTLED